MGAKIFALSAPAALLPGIVSAQALSQVAGIFNMFVGLMLVAAFLLYFGALAGWVARLGAYPSYRDEMIHLMMWAVAILFVLVLLLALIHFVQVYQAAAAFVFGIILFLIIVWIIMTAVTAAPKKDEDEH
jgi:hypothetical protein